MQNKVRIGELLIQKKLLLPSQLDIALDQQKRSGVKLGRILTENSFVSEAQISETLAGQLDIPYIDLDHYNIYVDHTKLLPKNIALRFHALILRKRGNTILIGMSDPTDAFAYNEIRRIFIGCHIEVAAITETCMNEVIEHTYPLD